MGSEMNNRAPASFGQPPSFDLSLSSLSQFSPQKTQRSAIYFLQILTLMIELDENLHGADEDGRQGLDLLQVERDAKDVLGPTNSIGDPKALVQQGLAFRQIKSEEDRQKLVDVIKVFAGVDDVAAGPRTAQSA